MQGTWVQSPVWEDPTSCKATKPMCPSTEVRALEPVFCNKRGHRNEKPPQLESRPLLTTTRVSGGSGGKEHACQCRRHERRGFDAWVGKIPWRRAVTHSIIFTWRIPMDRGAWRLQFMGSHRAEHNWSDLAHTRTTTRESPRASAKTQHSQK